MEGNWEFFKRRVKKKIEKIGNFLDGFMREENQEDVEFFREERRKNGEDWEFNWIKRIIRDK